LSKIIISQRKLFSTQSQKGRSPRR